MKMSKLNMFSFLLQWPPKKLFLFSCHVRGWKMRFKRIAMTRSGFGIKRRKIYCFFASTSAFSLSLFWFSNKVSTLFKVGLDWDQDQTEIVNILKMLRFSRNLEIFSKSWWDLWRLSQRVETLGQDQQMHVEVRWDLSKHPRPTFDPFQTFPTCQN